MSPAAGHGTSFLGVVSLALGVCCAALLAGLSALTVLDVFGRYLMDAPLPGAYELTQLMLGALVFAALPLTTRAGQHVEVDILYGVSPRLVRIGMRMLGALVAALVLAVIAWRLGVHAGRLGHDGATTNGLAIPLAPFGWFAAALAAISSGAAVLRVLATFDRDRTG